MAIKRFLQFTTRSSRDIPAESGSGTADDVSVVNRPLRFGQRAWATARQTLTSIAGTPPIPAVTEGSAAASLRQRESDARHLEIGGYFQADHAWAGSTHETAPLENIFDHDAERVFERFGPH